MGCALILLDTCALLWWTLQPDRLSNAAEEACKTASSQGVAISSVSIWEVGVKWRFKDLDLGGIDIREYVRRLQSIQELEIVPVSAAVWTENVMLDWEHRDPADRTIVATARIHDLPIVTRDEEMTNFYGRVIW